MIINEKRLRLSLLSQWKLFSFYITPCQLWSNVIASRILPVYIVWDDLLSAKISYTIMISLHLFLTALLISGYCDALTCNQTGELIRQTFENLFFILYFNRLALPTLYRGLWFDGGPITYNDVLITYPSNCTQPNILNRFSACDYSVVLGDGAIIPSPPDLNSASYFTHFIAWNRDSLNSFIDFDLTTATGWDYCYRTQFLEQSCQWNKFART